MFKIIRKSKVAYLLTYSLYLIPVLSFGRDTLTLGLGNTLISGQSLTSRQGNYQVTLEKSGNLVIYKLSNGQKEALWSSNTFASNAKNMVLTQDGNLVLYSYPNPFANQPSSQFPLTIGMQLAPHLVWQTGTAQSIEKTGATLAIIQDDGNFVLYDANYHAVWATGTWAR